MLKCRNVLSSALFALCLALAGTALAQNRPFLSNDLELSEATYVIRFTATENNRVDKFHLKFPPGMLDDGPILKSLLIAGKVKPAATSIDPANPNTLIVDLTKPFAVKAGNQIQIELLGLNNPPAAAYTIDIDLLSLAGAALETIPPLDFSIAPVGTGGGGGGSGDITAVIAGTGLSGGAASGDATLNVAAGAINTSLLADNAVTVAKLAANSVDSSKIVDGSIGSADVNTAQIQSRVAGNCAAGNAIRVIDSAGGVTCESVAGGGGDITAVNAGTGLAGGGLSGAVTLNVAAGGITNTMLANNSIDASKIVDGSIGSADVNTAQIQSRVTGTCAAGSSIRQINADGTVLCEVDDVGAGGGVTAVTASAPLASTGGTTPNISLPSVIIDGSSTALGINALVSNTGGSNNTAVGTNALLLNTIGQNNTAIGRSAGVNQTTGSGNLYLANEGVAGEDNTIRIGSGGGIGNHSRFFVAAVRGVTTGLSNATAVLIDGNNQLGTVSSSRRYKEDIRDMGEASSGLLQLRPVTFRYKKPYADGTKPLDYGLIAEEVAEIYPDLVVYDADGNVETVQYHKLSAMLLNEIQKLHNELQAQKEANRDLNAELQALRSLKVAMEALDARNALLETRLEALEQSTLVRSAGEVKLTSLSDR